MLNLSIDQQRRLGEQALQHYITALSERVAVLWPDECRAMGDEARAQAVRQGVDLAHALGFHTELDVARFVHLSFAFRSLHFHEQPWAQAILAEPELPPRIRMNRLFDAGVQRLVEREAQES